MRECTVRTADGKELVLSINVDKYGVVTASLRLVKRSGMLRFSAFKQAFVEEVTCITALNTVTNCTRPTPGEVWTVEGKYGNTPDTLFTDIVESVYDPHHIFP
jgi:hypothetical protein